MEFSIAIILSAFDIWKKIKWNRIKLVRLHFSSLNQISKVVILKVAIEVDQGASTLCMCGPLGINP